MSKQFRNQDQNQNRQRSDHNLQTQSSPSKQNYFRNSGWSDSSHSPTQDSPRYQNYQNYRYRQGSPAEENCQIDAPGCQMVILNPREELPPLTYTVNEEQPPYSTGHQNLRTFTKLFIHNIDFQITRDSLLRVFCQFGRIRNINMPIDGKSRPRGLAFITYMTHELAANALRISQQGIQLGQRKLRVEVFKPLETLERERGKVEVPKAVKSRSKKNRSQEKQQRQTREYNNRDYGNNHHGSKTHDEGYYGGRHNQSPHYPSMSSRQQLNQKASGLRASNDQEDYREHNEGGGDYLRKQKLNESSEQYYESEKYNQTSVKAPQQKNNSPQTRQDKFNVRTESVLENKRRRSRSRSQDALKEMPDPINRPVVKKSDKFQISPPDFSRNQAFEQSRALLSYLAQQGRDADQSELEDQPLDLQISTTNNNNLISEEKSQQHDQEQQLNSSPRQLALAQTKREKEIIDLCYQSSSQAAAANESLSQPTQMNSQMQYEISNTPQTSNQQTYWHQQSQQQQQFFAAQAQNAFFNQQQIYQQPQQHYYYPGQSHMMLYQAHLQQQSLISHNSGEMKQQKKQ